MVTVVLYREFDSTNKNHCYHGINVFAEGKFKKHFHDVNELVRYCFNSGSVRIHNLEGVDQRVFARKYIAYCNKHCWK